MRSWSWSSWRGPTLAGRLARAKGGLRLDEALSIATHVAEALAFAHRHHITHRDISRELLPHAHRREAARLSGWRSYAQR
jgi:serine/threonine protein kinase